MFWSSKGQFPLRLLLFLLMMLILYSMCSFLLFADDLKFFKTTKNCKVFKHCLNIFYLLCINNNLSLNLDKGNSITISHAHSPIHFLCFINLMPLILVYTINYLSFIFSYNLSFYNYTDFICSKSLKLLMFMQHDFLMHSFFIFIYTFPVHSIENYTSIIWSCF